MLGRAKLFLGNFFLVVLLVVDRAFKLYFKKFSSDGEFFIFKDWLKLKLAVNSGIAFGLPVNFYLLIVLYGVIIFFVAWLLVNAYRKNNLAAIIGYSLIMIGAWSNLADRIIYGHVIDYIDVKYYSVFNIADAMIFFGVVVMLFSQHFKSKIGNVSNKKR